MIWKRGDTPHYDVEYMKTVDILTKLEKKVSKLERENKKLREENEKLRRQNIVLRRAIEIASQMGEPKLKVILLREWDQK